MEATPIVDELVGFYQMAVQWTVRASVLALIVCAGLTFWWRRRAINTSDPARLRFEPLWMRLLLLILAGGTAILVAYTAHIGGVMVWGV